MVTSGVGSKKVGCTYYEWICSSKNGWIDGMLGCVDDLYMWCMSESIDICMHE